MMTKFYFIFFCVFAVEAVHNIRASRSTQLVDSFSTNFNFLNNFFSAGHIEGLERSTDNIPRPTISTLNIAALSYESVRGEFQSWCRYVNNTPMNVNNPNVGQFTNRPKFDRNFGSNTFTEMVNDISPMLQNMKQKLESIANTRRQARAARRQQQQNSDEGNFVLSQVLYELDKSEASLSEDINRAIQITQTLLSFINDGVTFQYSDVPATKTKCVPILDFANRALSPQQPTPKPSYNIESSADDMVQYHPRTCGDTGPFGLSTPKFTKCQGIFSKSTMSHFLKIYFDKDEIIQILNAVNDSRFASECNQQIATFIKTKYLQWSDNASSMGANQFLDISVCLDNVNSYRVTIVD